MNKKDFMDLTGRSRGQVDRLVMKGRFHVPGFGWFLAVKTGDHPTAPIDIQHERKLQEQQQATPAQAPVAGNGNDGADGDDDTDDGGISLKDRLTMMQIRKIEQQLADGRKAIRAAYKAELIEAVAKVLAPLKDTFNRMNLTAPQIEILQNELKATIEQLEKV